MQFKYSWLRSFHFTAKWGSITKASQYLNLSNSTLSHQIKELENKFKVKLFYRSGNKIYLTNIGISLKNITNRYFTSEKDIKVFLAKVRNRVNKVLNVGSENPTKIIPLISHLSKNKKIFFNLFLEKNDLLMEMFIKNKVDLLVINKKYFEETMAQFSQSGTETPSLESLVIDFLPFYTDHLCLAVHEKHPLLSRENKISWKDIFEERILLPHKSFPSRIAFDNLCQKLRSFPHQVMEISSREGVNIAVKNNLGIGVTLASEIVGRTGIRSLEIPRKNSTSKSEFFITDKELEIKEYLYFNHHIADLSLIKNFIQAINPHQKEAFFQKD